MTPKPENEKQEDEEFQDATIDTEEELDEALEESFPASDPLPPPSRIG
jgi:hypothetical protein